LRSFERSCENTLAKSTVQLFHGSPRSPMEDILSDANGRAVRRHSSENKATTGIYHR
jgi:hypothetical protein